jgi:hypothetical protein
MTDYIHNYIGIDVVGDLPLPFRDCEKIPTAAANQGICTFGIINDFFHFSVLPFIVHDARAFHTGRGTSSSKFLNANSVSALLPDARELR